MNTRFVRLWSLVLGGLGALAAAHPVFESDPYWHASLGREVLRQGARVVEERLAHPYFADQCVVPEWLWDVLAYGAMAAAGPAGLVWLSALVMGAFAAALGLWLARAGRGLGAGAVVAVALAVLGAAAWRAEARPELAGLLLLAIVLCVRDRVLDVSLPGRARMIALTAALFAEALWVQLHGSFVVGLAVLGLMPVELLLRRDHDFARRTGITVLLALLLSTTGAFGAGYLEYLLTHAGGDAKDHILDMRAPAAGDFAPFAKSAVGALTVVWSLALLGALRGRARRIEVMTALVGVPLVLVAHRVAGMAAVLAAPLALHGVHVLAGARDLRGDLARGIAVVGGATLLLVALTRLHEQRGPLLAAGETPLGHPRLAARWMRTLPKGAPVLTDYRGGAEIGYWLDGHVRTFVDGRTPMYFTDLDMALGRDLASSPEKLARGAAEFGFAAAMAERTGPLCETLRAAAWTPVVAEGLYTAFVPPGDGASPLPGLLPCGPEFFPPDPCAGEGAHAAAKELVRRTGTSGFASFLAAAAEAYCGDPNAALRSLPSERDAWAIRDAVRVARTVALLRVGDAAAANELMQQTAGREPALLLRVAKNNGFESLPTHATRPVLEAIARVMDDQTLSWVRVKLARVCAAERDHTCARTQATRASLAGNPEARAVLEALAQ